MRAIRTRAPAKVNLSLRVMAREEDGYHQLETVFQALDLWDDVWVRPTAGGVRLELDGPEPCPPEQNLAYRAAATYLARSGIRQGVEIRLAKRMPSGGGLGGGSSDGAAVLRALDALFEGELSTEALNGLAADLGADVPFFLSPSPLALGWGRGDRLLPLPPLPSAPVLLAIPAFSVSTPEAFRELARRRADTEPARPVGALDPELAATWGQISDLAWNDFHGPVFSLKPQLGELHAAMAGTGASVVLLSGSGSSLFALYDDPDARDRAGDDLAARFTEVNWIRTRTLTEMPGVAEGATWPAR